MAEDRIERETVIDAPAERVWDVLTSAEHLGTWFGDAADVDLRPGGTFRLHFEGYGTAHGRVERVEPTTAFAFRWNVATDDDAEPTPENSTLVEFSLTERGGSTAVTVVETGFAGLRGTDEFRTKHRQGNIEGWEQKVAALRDHAQGTAV